MPKQPCVYMMASGKNGTLYIGVTANLAERVWRHRSENTGGFTSRYNVKRLVWYQSFESIDEAIRREKQMKKWNRAWKLRLINKGNPDWLDLYEELN